MSLKHQSIKAEKVVIAGRMLAKMGWGATGIDQAEIIAIEQMLEGDFRNL